MAKATTIKERYEKARRKEKAIKLIEEKGVDIEMAFSRCGLKLSRFSYPPVRARYQQQGVEGLLENRGGAHAVKVTEDIKHYIRSVKEEEPSLSAGDICKLVQKRFSVKVHFSHMSRIVRRMGLNRPMGRPCKKEEESAPIAIDHAGSFVLKAATVSMGITDTIVEVIGDRIKEINKDRSNYSDAFMRMPILSSSAEVLRQKIETLLMMPVFGMERIWHFKTVYPRQGLGSVSGSSTPYKYHTMDNFLRELPRLDIDQSLSAALARCYVEAFALSFKTKEEKTFYIDCFRKVVWTKKNIPKGLHATRNRVMKCLDLYFIHDAQGHPLLPLTRPGDSYLGDALFPLIEALEQAVGHEVVEFSIFDREGLSVAVFQQFSRQKRCFVTMLRENQYQSLDDFDRPFGSRWTTYKKDPLSGKVSEQVLDCDKELIHSQSKESYKIRAILVRQVDDEDFAVVATNINREQEPQAGKVVDQYRARWKLQENSFKQMKPSLYLDSNHGTKSMAQEENRVVKRQVKSLEQKIEAKEKKIANTLKKMQKEQERLSQLEERLISDQNPIKDSEKYKKRIIRREKIKAALASSEHTLKTHQLLFDSLKKKQQALDPTELLYDIDTRKDHIMTNLETALNNADLFVKKHYLPKRYLRSDFRTIRDILYRQPGELLESKERIVITLNHYDQEPEHQRLAQFAAKKINAAHLTINNGKQLIIQVAPL